jgi:hypothetical protein
MKVPPATKPAAQAPKPQAGAKTGKQSKSFDTVLEEKAAPARTVRKGPRGGEEKEMLEPDPAGREALLALAGITAPVTAAFGPRQAPAETAANTPVSALAPPAITALVQEIAVVAGPPGVSSVDIQFNARTLDGLHVRVAKEAERLSIQFTTSNESVSRLLAANLDRLGDTLKERGYEIGSLRVERVRSSVNDGGELLTDRDGGGRGRQQQGGQRGGGEQRRR